MGALKHYYSEYFENYELLIESDSLDIFLSHRKGELRECFWSYEFYSVINGEDFTFIKDQSGNEIICGCRECKEFGEELFEYFAIFKALTSIKDTFSNFPYCLWVSSGRFIKESAEQSFKAFAERYKCDFLKTLGKDLASLMSGVALRQYNTEPTAEGVPF